MSSSDYQAQTGDAASDENRRASRKSLTVKAQMRDRRGVKFACELMDLSVTGFRADAFGSLSVGDTIWVSIPSMSGLEAKVAWRDNFTIGCRFHSPLHPATLDHLLKTLG